MLPVDMTGKDADNTDLGVNTHDQSPRHIPGKKSSHAGHAQSASGRQPIAYDSAGQPHAAQQLGASAADDSHAEQLQGVLIQASLETAPVQPLVQQLSQTQFSHRSMYHPAALRTDGSRSTAAQASAAQLTALLQSQQSTAFLHLAGTADADAEYLQDRRMSYEDGETRTGDPARTKALKQAYCEMLTALFALGAEAKRLGVTPAKLATEYGPHIAGLMCWFDERKADCCSLSKHPVFIDVEEFAAALGPVDGMFLVDFIPCFDQFLADSVDAPELLGQYILAFLKEMGAQLLSECIEARVVPCKKAGSVVDGQLVSDMLECSCGDCVGFALPQTVSRAIEGALEAKIQQLDIKGVDYLRVQYQVRMHDGSLLQGSTGSKVGVYDRGNKQLWVTDMTGADVSESEIREFACWLAMLLVEDHPCLAVETRGLVQELDNLVQSVLCGRFPEPMSLSELVRLLEELAAEAMQRAGLRGMPAFRTKYRSYVTTLLQLLSDRLGRCDFAKYFQLKAFKAVNHEELDITKFSDVLAALDAFFAGEEALPPLRLEAPLELVRALVPREEFTEDEHKKQVGRSGEHAVGLCLAPLLAKIGRSLRMLEDVADGGSPYDLVITSAHDEREVFVDVKATGHGLEAEKYNDFKLSANQLKVASQSREQFCIVRVTGAPTLTNEHTEVVNFVFVLDPVGQESLKRIVMSDGDKGGMCVYVGAGTGGDHRMLHIM